MPHTDSLLAVIMTSATNELFQLKFEFCAQVEGEATNRRINVMLDRKVPNKSFNRNAETQFRPDINFLGLEVV